jgi:hypothetical protein
VRDSEVEVVSVAAKISVLDKCLLVRVVYSKMPVNDGVRYLREYFLFTQSILLRCRLIGLHFGGFTSDLNPEKKELGPPTEKANYILSISNLLDTRIIT